MILFEFLNCWVWEFLEWVDNFRFLKKREKCVNFDYIYMEFLMLNFWKLIGLVSERKRKFLKVDGSLCWYCKYNMFFVVWVFFLIRLEVKLMRKFGCEMDM